MAFIAAAVYKGLKERVPKTAVYIISSIVAEVLMIAGYFIYESTVLGYGIAASASIISNSVQGITCLVLGNVLIRALDPLYRRYAIKHL